MQQPTHPIDRLIAQAAQQRPPSRAELRRQQAQASSLGGGLRGVGQQLVAVLAELLSDLPTVVGSHLSLTRRRGREFRDMARDLEQRAKATEHGHPPLAQAFYTTHDLEERGWTPGMVQRLGVPDQHALRDGRTMPLYSRNRVSLLEAHPHFRLNILSAGRHQLSSERSLETARIDATQALQSGDFKVPAGDYAQLKRQAQREAQLWWKREQRERVASGQPLMVLPEDNEDLTEGFALTLLRMATPLKLALSTPGWEMDPRDVHELTMLADQAIIKVYPQLTQRVQTEQLARERDLNPEQPGFGQQPGFGH